MEKKYKTNNRKKTQLATCCALHADHGTSARRTVLERLRFVTHARRSRLNRRILNFLAAPPARVGLLDTIYMQSNDSEPIPCCQVGQKLAKLSDFLNHLLAAKPTRSWQRGRKQCGCTRLTPAGASVLCLHFTICANFRFAIQFLLLIN